MVASERVVAKGHGRIYESVLNGPGTGYADKPKEVQRRIVFTSNPPEGIKQADWLSSQVEQFRATLKGVHDVPPVL